MLPLIGRKWRRRVVFIAAVAVLSIFLLWYREGLREVPDRWHTSFFNPEPASSQNSPSDIFTETWGYRSSHHPIDDLVRRADIESEELQKHETHDLLTAASVYRARKGPTPTTTFRQVVRIRLFAWLRYY